MFFPFALSCLFSTLDRKGLTVRVDTLHLYSGGQRAGAAQPPSAPPLLSRLSSGQSLPPPPLEALKSTYISESFFDSPSIPVLSFTRCLEEKKRRAGWGSTSKRRRGEMGARGHRPPCHPFPACSLSLSLRASFLFQWMMIFQRVGIARMSRNKDRRRRGRESLWPW